MSVIDEVKQRLDAVELIGRYVELRKAGTIYKGLCPFHSERTPSFVVYPDRGTWHCFGSCGTGGDIFNFVMRRENLEFREALELLARQAGVTLEAEQDQNQGQRNRLYELNEAAATYFQGVLQHHAGAAAGRAYLERRGINSETMTNFRLGFALEHWSALRDFLLEKGWSLDELLAAGLVKRHEERNSIYDAFRARVMIPIRDRQGKVIGFGGRLLGDGQPKYLNTAETPVFHKSQVVFGLDLAREAIRQEDKVVIVEGYMDVIAAHQHGFANVVACMGTSLTSEQLQQLHRFTNNFVIALDADNAGQQATVRGLYQARQSLVATRPTPTRKGLQMMEQLAANLFIAAMPDGLDPDDLIRQDKGRWLEFIDQARPLVDFYFDLVVSNFDLTAAQGKASAVAELAPLIAEIRSEAEQQYYIQRLSGQVRVDEQTITYRVRAAAKTSHLSAKPTKRRFTERTNRDQHRQLSEGGAQNLILREDAAVTSEQPVEIKQLVISPEEHLLANLLREPNILVWLARVTEYLEIMPLRPEEMESVENQETLKALKEYMAGDEQWDLELFQDKLTFHLHSHLAKLVSYGTQLPQCSLHDLRVDTVQTLINLRIKWLSQNARHLQFMQTDAIRQGDMENAKELIRATNQHIPTELFHLQQSKHSLTRLLAQSGEFKAVA